MKFLFYVGSGEYSLSTEEDLLKVSPSDIPGEKKILVGSKNLVKDVQIAYEKIFEKSIQAFNQKNPQKAIPSYFCKVNDSNKLALATGMLLRLGKEEEWNHFPEQDFEKIILLYQKQLALIRKLYPDYYIVNATVYFEKVPCLRVVGIPFEKDKEKALAIRISKNHSFSKDKISKGRKELVFQIKADFAKLYRKELKKMQEVPRKKKKARINYFQMQIFPRESMQEI